MHFSLLRGDRNARHEGNAIYKNQILTANILAAVPKESIRGSFFNIYNSWPFIYAPGKTITQENDISKEIVKFCGQYSKSFLRNIIPNIDIIFKSI